MFFVHTCFVQHVPISCDLTRISCDFSKLYEIRVKYVSNTCQIRAKYFSNRYVPNTCNKATNEGLFNPLNILRRAKI